MDPSRLAGYGLDATEPLTQKLADLGMTESRRLASSSDSATSPSWPVSSSWPSTSFSPCSSTTSSRPSSASSCRSGSCRRRSFWPKRPSAPSSRRGSSSWSSGFVTAVIDPVLASMQFSGPTSPSTSFGRCFLTVCALMVLCWKAPSSGVEPARPARPTSAPATMAHAASAPVAPGMALGCGHRGPRLLGARRRRRRRAPRGAPRRALELGAPAAASLRLVRRVRPGAARSPRRRGRRARGLSERAGGRSPTHRRPPTPRPQLHGAVRRFSGPHRIRPPQRVNRHPCGADNAPWIRPHPCDNRTGRMKRRRRGRHALPARAPRMGRPHGQRRRPGQNWRMATFVSLGAGARPRLSASSTSAPSPRRCLHIIEVDRLGAPTYRGPVGQGDIRPARRGHQVPPASVPRGHAHHLVGHRRRQTQLARRVHALQPARRQHAHHLRAGAGQRSLPAGARGARHHRDRLHRPRVRGHLAARLARDALGQGRPAANRARRLASHAPHPRPRPARPRRP